MEIRSAMRFFREVKHELAKVVWPSFEEFVGATLVVLVLVVMFAIYLFAVDRIFELLLRYVIGFYGG